MPNVAPDQADTYKCFATNEYGQAMVTVVLNVIEGKDCLLCVDMAIWKQPQSYENNMLLSLHADSAKATHNWAYLDPNLGTLTLHTLTVRLFLLFHYRMFFNCIVLLIMYYLFHFPVGFKKKKAQQQAAETMEGGFKTILKRKRWDWESTVQNASSIDLQLLNWKCSILVSSKVCPKSEQPEKKEGEIDPKFWELLLSADKKDYERICGEFGITDFRWMLKKLNEMKKEREEEQAQVCDFQL